MESQALFSSLTIISRMPVDPSKSSRCVTPARGNRTDKAAVILTKRRRATRQHRPLLTPREFEVLKLLANGRNSKDVAQLLGMSFKTALWHRSRILSKLNLPETMVSVCWAIRNGLLES